MNPWSILVADDEEDIRTLLESWLKPAGHTVLTAGSGSEALKLARNRQVDLVVADILMPDGDGLTLIDGVRKSQPSARVLAISGGGRYLDGQQCLKIAQGMGADFALAKPFGREQFLASVGKAMAARAPAKPVADGA